MKKFCFVLAFACSLISLPLYAEDAPATPAPAVAPESGGQSQDQAANDPTASISTLQLQMLYSGDYHNLENGHATTLQIRGAVPFKTGSLNHILRATIPLAIDTPSESSGLSDLTLFDLIVFPLSKGRWGIGPVILLPTATDDALGAEKWALGPALGLTYPYKKMLFGLFNQNLFTIGGDDDRPDVNVSILQPIFNLSLGNGWSVGTSEMNVTYDWEKEDWVNIPIGGKVSKFFKGAEIPVQLSASVEYNLQDNAVAPEWTSSIGIKMLF